jgi:hypothetical protein
VRAGRKLTPASWPGGARVAVCLSFDVDDESKKGVWFATAEQIAEPVKNEAQLSTGKASSFSR